MREYYGKQALATVLGYGGAIMAQNDGSSLSNCDVYNIGGTGAVAVDTGVSFSGPSSIKITSDIAAATQTDYEGVEIACVYANASRIRLSCKFRPIAANDQHEFWLGVAKYAGGVLNLVEVGYKNVGDAYILYYYDADGVAQEIAVEDGTNMEDRWHVMELEFDIMACKYISMRLDTKTHDLSAYATAGPDNYLQINALTVDICVGSTDAAAAVVYADEILCEAL